MIYFIADTHFRHNKEFIWGPRGFKSIDEQDNTTITNWNSTVKPEDEVYVLGDWFLSCNLDYLRETIPKLNGHIHLIAGNHDTDTKIKIYEEEFGISVKWADRLIYNKHIYIVSHFPMITGDLMSDEHRVWRNLFGHTHSKEKFYKGMPFMYNVACDAHNNTPISIEEIEKDIHNEYQDCISYLV